MNKGLIGIFEGATKNQKTRMGAAAATNYYTAKGYVVCWPPPDTLCDWDMLAVSDDGMGDTIKVQVKTTGYIHPAKNQPSWIVGLKDGCGRGRSHGSGKVPWNFDELCILDGDGEVTVMKSSDILIKPDGTKRKHSIVVPRFPSKARLPV